MNYSRRQLYAAGEPLGESVTRKEGGRIIYGGGGGGGGNEPAQTQTQISELPDWAKGYAKSTLAKTEALTDINQNPYQAYGANRIAGFSPLQQQSQQNAANMKTSGATGFGTQLAGAAGLGALGAQYDPTQFQAGQFDGGSAQQYMSPYMQNVVDIQQREAQRQGDIAGTQLASQATKSGAFGGGRQAIMEAEANRNLATQKGDIQARGLQSSYEQAQAQFNADQARRMQAQQLAEQSKQYGAGYGMQGLQTALQGAGQLGTLGGQEFAQGMDINKLQNAYGGQQQALQQQGLTQAYEDFQNQRNYPYKQLGFMSDMIRGLPLGQQSTRQVYEPAPSTTSQLAGIGTAAYGLSKFMAEGGVTSEANVSSILSKLSDAQLEQAKQSAIGRQDMDQLQAIASEMAERASMRKGLASIPMDYEAMMPDETVGMARGGILAFNTGGVGTDREGEQEARDYMQSQLAQNVSNAPAPVAATAPIKADPKSITSFIEQYKEFLGAIPQGDAYKEQEESYKNAPARAEATKKEDLSMALIQFGLNMAAGKSPRALQNIADAGVKTLPSMQEAYKQRRLTEEAGLKSRAELDRMTRAEQLAALTGGIGLYGKERDITAAAELEEAKHKKALEIARLTKEGKTPTDLINFVTDYVKNAVQSGDKRSPETIRMEGYNKYPGYVVKQEATAASRDIAGGAQRLTGRGQDITAQGTGIKEFNDLPLRDPAKKAYKEAAKLDKADLEKGITSDRAGEVRRNWINANTPGAAPADPRGEPKPIGLPDGARKIGTSGGKAVYQTPDGKQFIQN
jgi:hypothetical protein